MTETGSITEAMLIAHHSGDPVAASDKRLTARIAADPDAQATLAEWRRQDAAMVALYGPVAAEPVPDRLLSVLHAPTAETRDNIRLLRAASLVAVLMVGAAGGWSLGRILPPPATAQLLAAEAQRAHATYVVEVVHPVEVTADDPQHLATWLSRRVGHGLTPPDFTAYGFRLMGGRVVPSDSGAAALMMYDDDQGQRITVFVEPGRSTTESGFRFAQGAGAKTYSWDDEGISCAVTGDIPRDMLHTIALSAYGQLT